MYRLLIVDDEQHVVDWLYDLFTDVKHIEFDIYRAYSATSALEWLNKTKIDIVLTDINMPKMNGLQLIGRIRSEWPECRVIFLTGYNEFDFAYKAIQNDAVGYVLKTEEDDAIIKIVEKAVRQIEETLKMEEVKKEAKQQIKNVLPLIQREFIIELLESGKVYQSIQKQLDSIEISLEARYPVFLLLGRRDNTLVKPDFVENNEFYIGLNLICRRFLSAFVTSFYTVRDNYTAVWLIQPLGLADKSNPIPDKSEFWEKTALFIRDTLETVQAACKETLNTSVSFVLGCEPSSWDKLPEKYTELNKLLNYRMGLEIEMLLTDRGFNHIGNEELITIDSTVMEAQHKLGKLGLMSRCLESGQKAEFFAIMGEICNGLETVKSSNCNPALEIYYSISLMFLSFINKKNYTGKIAFRTGLNKLMRIDEHVSWKEAVNYLYSLAEIIFEIQSTEQDSTASDAISFIKQYVDNHLDEDLSLVKLADLVYFNPSYLSRLFKQVTGINLTDYIFEIKAHKAKLLLEDANLKIHEVASKVGYNSSTNFARFFKKMTGFIPQNYRDSVLSGKEKTVK